MEPEDTPPMSGSNSICVATVLLETGIFPMQYPTTELILEAPGGLVNVTAYCRDGKAEKIAVQNLASFAGELGVTIDVPGIGQITIDTAFGGDSFVVVQATDLNVELIESNARSLAVLGVQITNAANEQLKFAHPTNSDWQHFSFCLFAGPITRKDNHLHAKSVVAIQPGKIDRSPTGTAACARMALLHARGEMTLEDTLTVESIIGSEFTAKIVSETKLGNKQAILPQISGSAWITGVHQHLLDPDDPWPEGYRLSDTWPHV